MDFCQKSYSGRRRRIMGVMVYGVIRLTLNLCTINLVVGQLGEELIYNGFKEAKPELMVNGSAKILPNGLLQLTKNTQYQTGHAFYTQPIDFRLSLSFSTDFVFSITPNQEPNESGHGMAFTIGSSIGFFKHSSSSGLLGLFNGTNNGRPNHVVGIEFDTISSGDWKDIDGNHVGIDVDSVVSVTQATVKYYTGEGNKSLELASGNPIRVWVDYDGDSMVMNVALAPYESPKPIRPILSTKINLSDVFEDEMYVGFSAATGRLVSDQYVLGWSFSHGGRAKGLNVSALPLPPRSSRPSKPKKLLIIIPTVAAAIAILIISGSVYIWRKRNEEVEDDWEKDYGPQRFSYRSLRKAIKSFKPTELLGSGGFGKVYKGEHHSKGLIAVKKISHRAEQGMKEFVAEIVTMGRLRHRNLVPLLGYCRRKRELLLVYEYMPNGSLHDFLISNRKLDWKQRFRIIQGVASAILYLHEEWEQVVIHRDIKASNVLLDEDLNGRLGDFGLARFHDHGTKLQTTRVAGTVGYMAPELSTVGVATTSTDVFAFGAFMLEVVCGRRPVDLEKPQNEIVLVKWLVECGTNGSLNNTIDSKLERDYDFDEAELVLKLGLLCSHSEPDMRPSIREITAYLDQSRALPEIDIGGAIFGTPMRGYREGSSTTLTFPSAASFGFDTYTVMFEGR